MAVLAGCAGPRETLEATTANVTRALHGRILELGTPLANVLRVDSLDIGEDSVNVFLHPAAGEAPYRPSTIAHVRYSIDAALEPFDLSVADVRAGSDPLAHLIPNMYRDPANRDRDRMPRTVHSGVPVVSYPDRSDHPAAGLYGRHIALWPSHGWYYEPALDRWEWQRARLFQTVEDKFPLSFVLKYLVPMLENAGAEIYLARERDIQRHEAVVDNDGSTGASRYAEAGGSTGFRTGDGSGFAIGNPPYPDAVNPFRGGSFRVLPPESSGPASASWTPAIPDAGDYAVYLAWGGTANPCTTTAYTIRHAGGETPLSVDQSRGAGTWIYAGTYPFDAGVSDARGSVSVTNSGSEPANCRVTADAVRFGGGMGNTIRGESTSGRPRYLEAARYYLQFAGAPDTLVYDLSPGETDYTDDYRSRGEWVNWLRGAPFGPNADREHAGLGIPIDLSLAFHTDAGVTRPDSSIGTLSIFSTTGLDTIRVFPDGMSRMANRDFADILQTQIVDDIRVLYDPAWQRRSLWDRDYSEAVRPNVPSALLELLSHQNLFDMQFGLDPAFQFDASRAIYKAMLRFLATQYDVDYIVQPLPVTHFSAKLSGDLAELRWRPRVDVLEPTAAPDRYLVQTRIGYEPWDNGTLVDHSTHFVQVDTTGVVVSFRVIALNDGGRSFPSEVLAVGRTPELRRLPPVHVINAFDRVAAPARFRDEDVGGLAFWADEGVPDGYDISYTGRQYDFSVESPWLDDDAPGFGASHATHEDEVVAGNTFDFVRTHGEAILDAGYAFDSASDESVMDDADELRFYAAIDLILGEEKRTGRPRSDSAYFAAFPEQLQSRLRNFAAGGGALLVTGAYVGSDLASTAADSAFAAEVLRIRLQTDNAAATGDVFSIRNEFGLRFDDFRFVTDLNSHQYAVESPDAIEPVGDAVRILRYTENNKSAAVAFDETSRGIIAGFPFEAIDSPEARAAFMRTALDFLLGGTE